MKLGDRLKILRDKLELNQKEMAKNLGIATSTYQNYERNERTAPETFIVTVSTAFEVSLSWLLLGEGEIFNKQPSAEERQRMFKEGERAAMEALYRDSPLREAVEALSEDRMLEKIVLMLADMSEEERREVFDHVQKTKRFSELEREVQALKAERAG